MKYILIAFSLILFACSEPTKDSSLIEMSFNQAMWQNNISNRRAMLNDFLAKYDVQKQNRSSIKKLLGEPDGYDLYDEFPAYRLKEKGDCVVAFPIDRKTGKVKRVLIEPENCLIQGN